MVDKLDMVATIEYFYARLKMWTMTSVRLMKKPLVLSEDGDHGNIFHVQLDANSILQVPNMNFSLKLEYSSPDIYFGTKLKMMMMDSCFLF